MQHFICNEYNNYAQRDLQLCKVLLKRQINLWKEDSIMIEWNHLSDHFNQRKCWCQYVQSLIHKRVSHLIENHATIQRNITVKLNPGHGCMYAICPSIWVKRLNTIDNIILKSKVYHCLSLLKTNVRQKKNRGNMNFIKGCIARN